MLFRSISDEITLSLRRLLIIFLVANIYFLVLYHITNIYISKHIAVELFILFNGGGYTTMFWIGQVGFGLFIPLAYEMTNNKNMRNLPLTLSSLMIVIGGFFAVAVIIIGGQAFQLNIFPDHNNY